MVKLTGLLGLDIRRQLVNLVPNLNKGGCAIVAHSMYTHLVKTHKDVKILFMVRNDDDYLIKKIEGNKPTSCNHALVQVNGVILDSEDTWSSRENLDDSHPYRSFYEVSSELCLKSVQEVDSWNPRFDRKYVKIIQHVFGTRDIVYHK